MSSERNTAAVMTSVGHLALEQRERPRPGPGEVQVRVHTVTICGSDVHYFRHGRIADFVVDGPLVLGHETSGTVTDVGADVDPARVGERVALEPGISCGTCRQCLTGHYNLCPHMAFHATPPYDGSLQQYVVLPHHLVHRVPDSMSFERAALVEPVAVAVQAVRRAALEGGERVLVTGCGAIGLLCAQVARETGAGEVLLSDADPARVEGARRDFGLAATEPDGVTGTFDRLIECSGADAALRAGIDRLRPGGTAVLVGMGQAETTALPLSRMLVEEISLVTTFRYANAYPAAVALAASGRLRLDELVGARFSLAEAERAFTTDPSVLRAAVRVEEEDRA